MRCGRIPDGDNLFRFCTHPISFKGKTFEYGKAIWLSEYPDRSLLTSLSWERFAPTAKLLHACGCRLALGINEKAKAKNKYKDKNKSIYCGAYQLRASAVRALPNAIGDVEFADVFHQIENGEIAHAALKIVLVPRHGLDIENTKTAIVDRLWNACGGPLRHVCECDREIHQHPSASLITAPGGAYVDTRSHISRFWSFIRYQVLNWLWQRSLRKKGGHG
jgi:hypothetical protein